MFFDRPDYHLASAVPGTFVIGPAVGMIAVLKDDYASTAAMIFGAAPAFDDVLASALVVEQSGLHHSQVLFPRQNCIPSIPGARREEAT